jgi:arylsulfatase A-like enzyme
VIEVEPRNGNSPARDVFYLANPVLEPKTHSSPDRPNVIIVAADALRADHLSCYGYSRTTSPEIDRFSRDSILFENAVSQAPWTLPSFASLFTSLYPSFHGTTVNDTRLLPSSPTLIGILREAGYTTMACVRNQFVFPRYGFADGFDVFYGSRGTTEHQLSLVGRWLETSPNRPLFLFYHLLIPHAPYEAPAPFAGTFLVPGLPVIDPSNEALKAFEEKEQPPTKAELDALRSLYDERILYLDSLVGSLLAQFRRLGLYEDSLIIFVSDHGEQFWEHEHLLHAHTLYQEEIHVPLILKLPRGRGPVALRVSERVLGIDLMPSILDYLKIAPPPDVQGKSVLPLARGEGSREEVVFSELNFLGRTAAFKGRYKYITTDPAAYAQGVLSHGLEGHRAHRAGALEEIFDLDKDPGETRNILPDRPDLAGIFRREVKAFAENAVRYRAKSFKSPDANRIKLDKAEKEKLRALGYLR